ncbi:MAG: ABC transporter permease [Oscillospiraceae bacterium]
MAKFFKMVHNEFIKIFAKVSTKIFLLFILLMVILFNIMMRIQVNYAVSLGGQNNKEELQSLRDSDIINDKIYLEEKEFIIDNELDKSDQSTSWRETRVGAIFAQKMEFIDNNKLVLPESLKKHHDKQLELIKNNDAKAYCDYMISWVKSNNDMTQKDKDSEIWMYEFITKNNIYTPDETADGTWKSELFGNVLSQKTIYENLKENNNAGNEEDAKAFSDAEKGYLTGIYRIENNVKYVYQGNSSDFFDTKNAYWSVIGNSISLISIISLIVIIVAGAMISSEFSGGTIKFLLINPISRGKILMSKYFCLISVSYIFIAAFFVFNVIV